MAEPIPPTSTTPPTPPSIPVLTSHAVQRFQERIEPIELKVLTQWMAKVWKCRKGVSEYLKTEIRKREYKGHKAEYLVCRSPGGKPVFLALNEDRSAVLTVLTAGQWSRFVGTPVSMHEKHTERAMRKLIKMDTHAEKKSTSLSQL